MHKGILVSQEIELLMKRGAIACSSPISVEQVQPSSFDQRIGRRAYKVMASTIPKHSESKDDFIRRVSQKSFDLDDELLMEKDAKYLVELEENVQLPADVSAVINNKSSSGRINVRTKLISSCGYDVLHKGFTGFSFLEMTPRSFPIIIRSRDILTQMRFFRESAELADDELGGFSFVFDKIGKPLNPATRQGILLTIDLDSDILGYKAKRNTPPLDLARRDHDPEDFFEVMRKGQRRMILNKDEFYILSTQEFFSVPWNFIGEMQPYDLTSGEFRSHYAGFIDPGFGFGAEGEVKGRPLTLEVVPHDDLELHHGQVICKVKMERTSQKPDKIYGINAVSHYHQQSGPQLSKHFHR